MGHSRSFKRLSLIHICLLLDEQGSWLVKFRHTYDPSDMSIMEYRYNEIARQCEITVPDFRLFDGKYFATKRFDIENENRLHIATAGALLNESIQLPKLDYKTLLHLTGYLTQDPHQVDEMFKRMVFNILTDNKDDHAKNFSFICREGTWSLAPAYDLTLCNKGYNGGPVSYTHLDVYKRQIQFFQKFSSYSNLV